MRKVDLQNDGQSLCFRCPACRFVHAIQLGERAPNDQRWSWNNDYEYPTINGSVLVQGYRWPTIGTQAEQAECDKILRSGRDAIYASKYGTRCHSKVENGVISFYEDSRHPMRGDFPLENWDK